MNIVVLAGGTSTERDISILTSTKVCESLRRNGYNANIVDVFFGIDSENVDNFFNNDNDLEKLCKYLKNHTPDVEKELEARKALGRDREFCQYWKINNAMTGTVETQKLEL